MRRAAVLTGLLCLAVPAIALAQEAPVRIPGFSLERLELDASATHSLLVGSGQVLPRHSGRVFLGLHYQRNPLVLTQGGVVTDAVVKDRMTLHLGGAFALFDRFELMLQVAMVAWQAGDDVTSRGYLSPDSFGIGAPSLGARVQILRAGDAVPLDLAAELQIPIPIGSSAALANDPGFGLYPKLSAGFPISRVRLSAELGAKIRPVTQLSSQLQLGTQFNWGVAASAPIQAIRAEIALRGAVGFTPVPVGMDLLVGGRYQIGDFELFLLAGPGLGRAPGTPTFRLLLGGAFNPVPKAQAEKKAEPPPAPRCDDGKVHEPEECPDLDFDGDGVRNAQDQCPKVAEDKDGLADADGCPEDDADGDGVKDTDDACPTEAGAPEAKGCPVKDKDGDGVLDADDACPDEAGPAARKGCPPRDQDGDGILDEVDACPAQAGIPEARGCPPKDQDEDTVPDHLDNCPREKGDPKNQGCPAKKKQLVVITKEKLIIKEKVFFATAKATIQARSLPLLDQVAQVLVEHPEIVLVHIEGHTDNTGSAETNRALSQARADAVRDHLMKKGVIPARLKAVGYGPDRPAEDNKTAKGREANRRVEFIIADQQPQMELKDLDEDLTPLVPAK